MANGPQQWFFDAWSRVYDAPAVQRAIYHPVHDDVVAELSRHRPDRVLDIGCGTGILSERLRTDLGARVVGCDFSAGMLEQAAQRSRAVAWLQGDAVRLPFTDASFAAAVSTESFHWFPDPDGAAVELARVVRPGGRFLVAFINTRTEAASRMLETGARVAGQPARWPTRDELRQRLERAGFAVERQTRVRRLAGLVIPTVLTVAVRR